MVATVRSRRVDGGFTLVGLLLVLAVVALSLTAVVSTAAIVKRRDAEAALLERGRWYREALLAYARNTPPGAPSRPRSLSELLRDPRHPEPRRYLRDLMPDPITLRDDWVLLLDAEGGIAGLHSASARPPLKVDGFPPPFQDFAHRARLDEWVFWGQPAAGVMPVPVPVPGAAPVLPLR
ncbi:type II secretion system protein [Roseateles noduli]|uniref:type II secretion system protein n=1 Tax=Roseateles noduli TaxID=2052484 RepID=UPI003D6481DC